MKVSLLYEEKKKKRFFECYATGLHDAKYAFTNISGVEISIHI